jgi:hypothetical protein
MSDKEYITELRDLGYLPALKLSIEETLEDHSPENNTLNKLASPPSPLTLQIHPDPIIDLQIKSAIHSMDTSPDIPLFLTFPPFPISGHASAIAYNVLVADQSAREEEVLFEEDQDYTEAITHDLEQKRLRHDERFRDQCCGEDKVDDYRLRNGEKEEDTHSVPEEDDAEEFLVASVESKDVKEEVSLKRQVTIKGRKVGNWVSFFEHKERRGKHERSGNGAR